MWAVARSCAMAVGLEATVGVRARTGAVAAVTRAFSSSSSAGAPAAIEEDPELLAAVQEQASRFAAEQLQPNAAKWDEEKHFPVDTFREAAALGFGALYCTEDVGGTGLGRAASASVFEALAYHDVSFATYLTIHNMNCWILSTFANQALRDRLMPDMVTMNKLSSYCLTEPGSGSDAAALRTTARRDGGDFVLNGSKAFISGAGSSDVYLVMARVTDAAGSGGSGSQGITCFAVEKGMPGLSFGKNEDKLGWCSQPTRSVIMEDVRVPAENIVGKEGEGFKVAMRALDGGRINIATCSVGGAAFCVDAALQYCKERQQFGRSIADFQYSQFKLADMATSVQASRLMVQRAARSFDEGLSSTTVDAAMAKRFATDTCYNVANDALQMFGGYGYLKDYPVERYVRDLRVHTILEGTNEIMRLITWRALSQRA